MSALVERIIAARDGLRPLRVQSEDYFRGAIGVAVDALAEAGNAIYSYEKTMRVIAEAPGTETSEMLAEAIQALKDVLPYAEACVGLPRPAWPIDSVITRAERIIERAEKTS